MGAPRTWVQALVESGRQLREKKDMGAEEVRPQNTGIKLAGADQAQKYWRLSFLAKIVAKEIFLNFVGEKSVNTSDFSPTPLPTHPLNC